MAPLPCDDAKLTERVAEEGRGGQREEHAGRASNPGHLALARARGRQVVWRLLVLLSLLLGLDLEKPIFVPASCSSSSPFQDSVVVITARTVQ